MPTVSNSQGTRVQRRTLRRHRFTASLSLSFTFLLTEVSVWCPGTAVMYGLSLELLLEREQPRFLGLTLLLVCALSDHPGLMLLIQPYDALEQALLAGAELLPLCNRQRSRRLLWLAVPPPLIERDHKPQAGKTDDETIGSYTEERIRTRAS